MSVGWPRVMERRCQKRAVGKLETDEQ
jgi:hypothetical protein